MAKYPHLGEAPITEAVIDIKIQDADSCTMETMKKIVDELPDEFTDIQVQNEMMVTFDVEAAKGGGDPTQNRANRAIGYVCRTKNELNVAQIKLNGFTFSELKPYSNWDEFSEKAKKIWEIYCKHTKCELIKRIAVRYINHMELPIRQGEEFSKYLNAPPIVPKNLPQGITNFLSRVTIGFDNPQIFANVTQAPASTPNSGVTNIILDIDVYRSNNEGIAKTEIWNSFEELRNIKNDIFFEYITADTRDIFK